MPPGPPSASPMRGAGGEPNELFGDDAPSVFGSTFGHQDDTSALPEGDLAADTTPSRDESTSTGLVGEGAAIAGLGTAVKAALQSKLSPEQFQTWFQRSKLVRIDDAAATIAVPNSFAKDWIERYYGTIVEECVFAVLGAKRKVVLVDQPESLVTETPTAGAPAPQPAASARPGPSDAAANRMNPHRQPAAPSKDAAFPRNAGFPSNTGAPAQDRGAPRRDRHGAESTAPEARPSHHERAAPQQQTPEHPPQAGPPTSALRSPADGAVPAPGRAGGPASDGAVRARWNALDESSDFVLNAKCTFDNFVVGPCNRFGHAASMGAAEQPGKSYNPLFLHGRVGVGKTHLLQAFCFAVLDRFPESRILYLSCETFVNHFINALENGDTSTFREKYRNIDVLVVDDIQILANKEKTQEEFFHTFNSLYNSGKQIVLSSDSPPKDIPTLQDRLVSRFKWGMVTEIEPPCYETRMAIVKRKSRDRNADMPDEVVQFIAENIEENVRELEGAVTRLIGYARLNNAEITLDMAREALAGLIEVRRGAPTVDDIISLVTEHYQVKLSDLQSKRRTKAIAFPRQVAMYLVRKVTRHSLEEIGGFFGGRDHTTVLYAVEKIERLISEDLEFSKRIQRFLEQLA